MTDNERLARVLLRLIHYRGHGSPEALANSYRPDKPPISSGTIRRIVGQLDEHLSGEDGELKLVRLSGMLHVPPTTLGLVLAGDTEGIARLEFGDDGVRQYIIDSMTPPRRRRRLAKSRGTQHKPEHARA